MRFIDGVKPHHMSRGHWDYFYPFTMLDRSYEQHVNLGSSPRVNPASCYIAPSKIALCMYTDGKGGKPNDRAMFLHPSFWHNDKDAQRITEYELKGVSVPTYETAAYSYDPNFFYSMR